MLKRRDQVMRALRRWFYQQGFVEVQTPVLINAPAPEPSIETFCVPGAGISRTHPGKRHDLYLIPSPELHMKRLLAKGMEKIFQITPVFRREEYGKMHLPQFTMLEWYRASHDYSTLMEDCESLMSAAARGAGLEDQIPLEGGGVCSISGPFIRMTVNQAFETYAGWIPGPEPDPDRFDMDMVEKVEPGLPMDRPVFLFDYPASMASLARLKPSDPEVAERVELYAGGIELANGFSELNNPDEQRRRFIKDMEKRRESGLKSYPMPEEFMKALENMPPAAGMALGIDRLLMFLFGTRDITEVVAFAE